MTLFDSWTELIENQIGKESEEFWDEYFSAEMEIYGDILTEPTTIEFSGVISELASQYKISEALFMGFLDGVNSSLKEPLELKELKATDSVTLLIDFEKLFFNMLVAQADHLYNLEEWEDTLSFERRDEIVKEYKKSRTIVKEKTAGRNDPCPCGSGKKHKKCCGQ